MPTTMQPKKSCPQTISIYKHIKLKPHTHMYSCPPYTCSLFLSLPPHQPFPGSSSVKDWAPYAPPAHSSSSISRQDSSTERVTERELSSYPLLQVWQTSEKHSEKPRISNQAGCPISAGVCIVWATYTQDTHYGYIHSSK